MDRMGTGQGTWESEPRQAHLVGLDGRGMPGLAQMLLQRGFRVTGSVPTPNLATDRLRSLGVRVHAGHSPRSVPRSARLLVYSQEVPREHPDRLSAATSGVEQASCSEVLTNLLRRGIGVATVGGRKASLAAAMVGWTLTHAGLDPTVVLGSVSPQLGGSGRLGRGPHVIVDAVSPTDTPSGAEIVIIHEESAGSARQAQLQRWVDLSPPGGYVLGFADELDDCPKLAGAPLDVERFSLAPGHAWWGSDLRESRGCYRFRAFHRGRFALEVQLQVPGRHHVLGALAAVAVCTRVSLPPREIKEALEEFGGISRGFESRGSYRGVTLVDDEASESGEVGASLTIAREVFGRRRVCVVYQLDEVSCRDWPGIPEFLHADRVWIIDGRAPEALAWASALVDGLKSSGIDADRVTGLDEAICELDRHLEPGDVLVTLGTGDVGTIADAFLRRLSSDRHPR